MVCVSVCFWVSLRDCGHFCLDFCGDLTGLEVRVQYFKCCDNPNLEVNHFISLLK